jgi:type II secretory pathway component PulM
LVLLTLIILVGHLALLFVGERIQRIARRFHAIRAAVAAMQTTFRRVVAEGGIAGWKATSPRSQRCLPCR